MPFRRLDYKSQVLCHLLQFKFDKLDLDSKQIPAYLAPFSFGKVDKTILSCFKYILCPHKPRQDVTNYTEMIS